MQADFSAMPPVPKPPTPKSGRNRNLVIALAVAAVVVAALIAASVLRSGGDEGTSGVTTTADTTATDTTATDTTGGTATDPALALVAGIPQSGTVLGQAGTTVRMLQFEDLQCPICKRYTDDAFPAIVNEYVRTGRLKIDFRGLAFLGPDSLKALKIALAAGLQNKLWQVVGLFYENQGAENSGWVTDSLINQILAQVPGLDAAKVKVDAQGKKVANQIAAVQAEATKLEVQGTPWFYLAVGFNPPVNFQPRSLTPSDFRTPIDQALKAGSP
jgi:protein-disulfide isomerase